MEKWHAHRIVPFKKNSSPYWNIPRFIKEEFYCSNCKKAGHLCRNCPNSIMSFGLIAFKVVNSDIQFLLIRRRNTISYIDFIRGHYKDSMLLSMFDRMTNEELENLSTYSYDTLWNSLWLKDHRNKETAQKRYAKVVAGFYIKDPFTTRFIDLRVLIQESKRIYTTPEYGFPKGRKNKTENNIEAAEREFQEETGMKHRDYKLINLPPIEERFIGIDQRKYTHIYYIAECHPDSNPVLDVSSIEQTTEISWVGFLSYSEAMTLIRDYHKEKKDILTFVYNEVKSRLN